MVRDKLEVTCGKDLSINNTETPQTCDQLDLEFIEGTDFVTTLKPSTKCCKWLMLSKFSAASQKVSWDHGGKNS